VAHDILGKAAKMYGMDLTALSLDTVKMFSKDAKELDTNYNRLSGGWLAGKNKKSWRPGSARGNYPATGFSA